MISTFLIDGWVEVLLTLVLVTGAFIVTRRDLLSVLSAYTIQSLFLVFIALLLYLKEPSTILMYLAALTLISKVFIIPYMIKNIQKRMGIKRDIEFHYLSPVKSLLVTILIFLFVYYPFSMLLEDMFLDDKLMYTGAVFGISLMLMGMLVTFTREKMITKIIGYVTIENGVLLFGLFITELPFIIEVLIIVDLVMFVLLATIFAIGIDSGIEEFHNRLHPIKGQFREMLSTSHKLMQILSMAHALLYLIIAAYLLFYANLPLYYFVENYVFIDYLSLYEILIASTVFFFAAMYAGGYVDGLMRSGELIKRDLNIFYIAFNLLLIATVVSFSMNNIALFWIFAELTTVFSALLVAILNSKKNIDAALKYVFITSTAMLFSFVGIMLLFEMSKNTLGSGTLNWDVLLANAGLFPEMLVITSVIFIFIGFAAKSGISPFHTWLPHAHAKAPSAVSAILSGAILNIGIYGILRIFAIVNQTTAWPVISKLLLAFGILTIFVAALTMLYQKDLKKLIAFSSVEHMGILILGIGIGTPVAIFWVLFHTLAHSMTKALLFLSAGILHRQYLSNKAENMKNVFKVQPLTSLALVLGAIAIVGMPPFPIFISKLSLLLQFTQVSIPLLFAVLIFLLIASVSIVIFLTNLLSNVREGEEKYTDQYKAPLGMRIPLIALIIIIFAIGILFPEGLSKLLETIVKGLGF